MQKDTRSIVSEQDLSKGDGKNMSATLTEKRVHNAIELDRRPSGSCFVRLLWLPEIEKTIVEQTRHEGESIFRDIPNDQAMSGFNHPEVYDVIEDFAVKVTKGEIELPQLVYASNN